MEKETYIQLDRIEMKLDELLKRTEQQKEEVEPLKEFENEPFQE